MRFLKPISLGLIIFAASCVQILGDNPYSVDGQDNTPTKPCVTATDCDDSNPCTTEICGGLKICTYQNMPNGSLPTQTAGDCVLTVCEDGTLLAQQSPDDVPGDNEPCTTDACSGSTPSNTPLPDNGVCQRGNQSGTCQGGICQVACSPQNPCDDSNPCTTDSCDSGTSKCIFTNIDGLPTPNAAQPVGDCKVQLCVVGKDTAVNDDADVPVDGNSCSDDVCTAGVPSNPGTASGTYCAAGSPDVCDGSSNCVQCVAPENCVGITETDCIKRDCDLATHTCKQKYLGNETTAFAQTTGDCQRNVCNGTDGGTVSIADDTDKPNDNNSCTTDSCMGGVKTFNGLPQGTNCGGTKVCSATGVCVGCNAPTDCQGVDDFCKMRTCIANTCGTSYTANNTPLPAPNQTPMDCKVVVCDGAGNTKMNVDQADLPPDDGKQCTSNQCSVQGTPTYPNLPPNSACSQSGGDVCDGLGNCKKSIGKNCLAGSECISANCIDSVCCSSVCGGTCKACNIAGSLGTCVNVPPGQDDAPICSGLTVSCDGSGACKKDNGQACATNNDCLSAQCVDGICCNTSCTATCFACNVAGTCAPVPIYGTDNYPANTCTGTNACDGAGSCKLNDGQPCVNNSDCVGGSCGLLMGTLTCLP